MNFKKKPFITILAALMLSCLCAVGYTWAVAEHEEHETHSEEGVEDLFDDEEEAGEHDEHGEDHDEDGEEHDEHGEDHDEDGEDHEEEGHAGHDEHGDGHEEGEEEGHEGHDEHAEEGAIRLTDSDLEEFGIEVATAAPGVLERFVLLPGEVRLNGDRLAHVVPRVSGVVRSVKVSLGARVAAGQVLAVIDSRELAEAKAALAAARGRVALRRENFEREEILWKKRVSAEQEYLDAKAALSETLIEAAAAEQNLRALGLEGGEIAETAGIGEGGWTRYEIIAPFGGTVIQKHISLGEMLKDDADAFVIAALDSVWVDLSVYSKDLPRVREEQNVIIDAGEVLPEAEGKIAFVSPLVDEETRTALARIVLPNAKGSWRPGTFVNAKVAVGGRRVPILVPMSALQTIEGESAVFIQDEDGFEPRHLRLGQDNGRHVEVLSGLEAGERFVAKGAFTLKAQLSKGAFGDGHNH